MKFNWQKFESDKKGHKKEDINVFLFPNDNLTENTDTRQLWVDHASPELFFLFERLLVSKLLILYNPVVIFHVISCTSFEVVNTLLSDTKIKHKSY